MGVFACRGRPPGHPAFFRAVEGAGPYGQDPGFSRVGAGLVPARVSTTRVAPTGKTPSLAEFFARRRKTIWIVFSGSVYLGKNTSHLARQTKLIPLRFCLSVKAPLYSLRLPLSKQSGRFALKRRSSGMSALSCHHTEANDMQPATTQCAQRGVSPSQREAQRSGFALMSGAQYATPQ